MKFTDKKIRMLLGLIMFMSFIMIVQEMDFMIRVTISFCNNYPEYNILYVFIVVIVTNYYLWVPCLLLIIIIYLILTRIYKYKKGEQIE